MNNFKTQLEELQTDKKALEAEVEELKVKLDQEYQKVARQYSTLQVQIESYEKLVNETNKQKRMSQDAKSDLVEENKNLKARFDALL